MIRQWAVGGGREGDRVGDSVGEDRVVLGRRRRQRRQVAADLRRDLSDRGADDAVRQVDAEGAQARVLIELHSSGRRGCRTGCADAGGEQHRAGERRRDDERGIGAALVHLGLCLLQCSGRELQAAGHSRGVLERAGQARADVLVLSVDDGSGVLIDDHHRQAVQVPGRVDDRAEVDRRHDGREHRGEEDRRDPDLLVSQNLRPHVRAGPV